MSESQIHPDILRQTTFRDTTENPNVVHRLFVYAEQPPRKGVFTIRLMVDEIAVSGFIKSVLSSVDKPAELSAESLSVMEVNTHNEQNVSVDEKKKYNSTLQRPESAIISMLHVYFERTTSNSHVMESANGNN